MLWFLRKVFGAVALAWLALWLLFLISLFIAAKEAAGALLAVVFTSYVGVPASIIWAVLKVVDVLSARRAPGVAVPIASFPGSQGPTRALVPLGTHAAAPATGAAGPVTSGVPQGMTATRTAGVSTAKPNDSDIPDASPPTGGTEGVLPKQRSVSSPPGPDVYTYSAPGQPPCPECGADNALVLRSTHVHHPPHWLRWLTVFMHVYSTHTYTCTQCAATVELVKVQARGRKW